jgi:hypothetical protein
LNDGKGDANRRKRERRGDRKDECNDESDKTGITIDRSDEYENAFDSIRVNCELDSNEIDESD